MAKQAGKDKEAMLGIWLLQLGTPASTNVKDIRKYLKEFLSDPRVIDWAAWLRIAFIYILILPFRAPKLVHAYKKIWRKNGSPLLHYSKALEEGLQNRLGSRGMVRLGMRYGSPSMEQTFQDFKEAGVTELRILPLYPQYASASTGSSLEKAFEILKKEITIPSVKTLGPFFDEDFFIQTWAERFREKVPDVSLINHVLFSFHGIPERQNTALIQKNFLTYREQCAKTSELLARALSLPKDFWTMSFQSRLGREPWLSPYTDFVLRDLPLRYKRVALLSPSFVADCLETLEENSLRGREIFLTAGGSELVIIEAPNDKPEWMDRLLAHILN